MLVKTPVEKHLDEISQYTKEIFLHKLEDYGCSWRVMRMPAITDQIGIKIRRIRNIDKIGCQKVEDSIENDLYGVINYCIIALIQLRLPTTDIVDCEIDEVVKSYDINFAKIRELLLQKNHDYGEAWREMRIAGILDIILMKILRIVQIEENNGATIISENVDANYMDIVNYCIFILIKIK